MMVTNSDFNLVPYAYVRATKVPGAEADTDTNRNIKKTMNENLNSFKRNTTPIIDLRQSLFARSSLVTFAI